MKKLTKIVNIYPSMPITGVNPPIRSVVKRVTKSISEIRTCLMARAIVEEVLPDGTTVRLNIGNYDKFSTENTNVTGCTCGNGNCTCGWEVIQPSQSDDSVISDNTSEWQIAYNKALAGKNLAGMTRKQRRSIEAAARAAADAAVAETPEVVMGVASIETVDEVVETSQESVEPVIETTEMVDETPVKTVDVEDVSETV